MPLQPNPTLATGEVSTLVSGKKLCLQANTSKACVPNGAVLDPDPCAVAYAPCVAGAREQQWRLSKLGEIQSALTSDAKQLMCLDASHGTVRARPGRLSALSAFHSESFLVWRVCMGTQGA